MVLKPDILFHAMEDATGAAAHVSPQVRLSMTQISKLHAEYREEIEELHSKNMKLRSELEKQGVEMEECRAQNERQQKELLTEMELNQSYQEELKQTRETNAKLVSEIDSVNKKLHKLEQTSVFTSDAVGKKVRLMMDENASQRADHFAELMKLHSKIEKLRFDLIQKDVDLEQCQAQCDQQCKQLQSEIQMLQCAKGVSAMRKELEVKSEALRDLESLNIALTVQELNARTELQEALEESVNGLLGLWNPPTVFEFKLIVDGDEKLKSLRREADKGAYNDIIKALVDFNEYTSNPSRREMFVEIWHSKEHRMATLKEIVAYLIERAESQRLY